MRIFLILLNLSVCARLLRIPLPPLVTSLNFAYFLAFHYSFTTIYASLINKLLVCLCLTSLKWNHCFLCSTPCSRTSLPCRKSLDIYPWFWVQIHPYCWSLVFIAGEWSIVWITTIHLFYSCWIFGIFLGFCSYEMHLSILYLPSVVRAVLGYPPRSRHAEWKMRIQSNFTR